MEGVEGLKRVRDTRVENSGQQRLQCHTSGISADDVAQLRASCTKMAQFGSKPVAQLSCHYTSPKSPEHLINELLHRKRTTKTEK